MAETGNAAANLPAPGGTAGLTAITDNPWLRQIAVMIGIAASVALGVAVVLWSQAPNFAPLYGDLAEKDASQIMEVLQQGGTQFRVDEASGMLMVPASKLKEIRMQLAAQGLPNSAGMGFELLQQETGFGTSQIVEKARYQQAMQGELARTISTIGAVHSARVHLAIPKQSVFVRKRQPPSASVTLRLHNGRVLEEAQVDAIVHLVASGVPALEPGRVTIVDHKGRLLSGDPESREMKLSATQFEHTRRIEEHYRERIEGLLAPIVGRDKVRAQVAADIDFTVTEQTQERYNPDQPALRSEQLDEQQTTAGGAAGGVPGALSNQPPAAGNAPENARAQAGAGAGEGALNSSRQATRNYELDRVISHTRMSPLSLRRLSVAVVVDDVTTVAADGAVNARERTPEEIERLTELVREAVGFDARRGDSVRVMNSSFLAPEPVADLPEIPIWEQGWFLDIVKQVGGLLLVLVLIFVVLRPTMKRLTATHAELAGDMVGPDGARIEGPLGQGAAEGEGEESLLLGSDGEPIQLPGGGKYENIMDAARQLVDEDPKRVAQLVKTWVGEDAA